MRIGELADLAGIAASTIRYYEKIGLLPQAARSNGGSRRYDEDSLIRLRMIKGFQSMGFALDDIDIFFADKIDMNHHDQVKQAIDTRLEELGSMIENLQRNRENLQKTRDILETAWNAGGCPTAEQFEELRLLIAG